MRSIAILLSLSLIVFATQDIDDRAVNFATGEKDLVSDYEERQDVEINDAIEVAVLNSDAELKTHEGVAKVNSQDAESIESDDPSFEESSDPYGYSRHNPRNGNFSIWHNGICSKRCGGGVETSTRVCDNPVPRYGGQQCIGCVSKIKTCNTQECPIDGQWSEWTEPKCSKTCGGGKRTKRRTCTNPRPKFGGNDCDGDDHITLSCNVDPCPINGGWTAWKKGPCSKSCGGGSKTNTRTCSNPEPKYNGKNCLGDESVTGTCNTHPCPIDGNWTPYSSYGKCSQSCEGGKKWRKRTCTNPEPKYGGEHCKGTKRQAKDCNGHPCPKYKCLKPMDFVIVIGCAKGDNQRKWLRQVKYAERMVDLMYKKFADARVSLIGYCANVKTFNGFNGVENYYSIKKSFRKLESLHSRKHGKSALPAALKSAYDMVSEHARSKAFRRLVVISSNVLDLSESDKTKFVKLKKNFKTHERTYISVHLNRNYIKTPLEKEFCPVDGDWSTWIPGTCSKTCGGGSKTRKRACKFPSAKYGGKRCAGQPTEILPCNTQHCPVDGVWSAWTETECTKTCGGGKKTRRRSCEGQAYGGKSCVGKSSEVVDCNANPCPINGGWAAWSLSKCTKSCGGGESTKSRTCTQPKPQYKGKICTGYAKKVIGCNTHNCPIDGNWGAWKDGSCTKSCGGGTYKRTRLCNNPKPQYNGKVCPGEAMEQNTCNSDPCPVDGGWSAWVESQCSKSCGGGSKTFTRSCTKPSPKHKGKQCSTLIAGGKKIESCNSQPCPVDGHWGSWTEGPCSKKCGGGKKTRVRLCNNPKPFFGGKACAGMGSEELACNPKPCPVHGKWTPWTSYTKCSKSCGGGVHSRSRTCTSPKPQHGGRECIGKASHTKKCKTQHCPIDGKWSSWTYMKCSKSCGGGLVTKWRKCNSPRPQHGGKSCEGKADLKEKCGMKPCPIPGKWTRWSVTKCTKVCGGGTKQRSRTCTNPAPKYGGMTCVGTKAQEVKCNTHHCPIDGKWSKWSDAKCTKKCNGGTITRTRLCNSPEPQYKGKDCAGKNSFTKPCNEHPCPKYICHKPLDLIIALDFSNSLTQETWRKQINFALKLITAAFREHPKVNIGILHFGTRAVIDLSLAGSGGSFYTVRNKLRGLFPLYPSGGSKEWTRTDLALLKAADMFRKDGRSTVTKILAVLTDGFAIGPGRIEVSPALLKRDSGALKSKGIHILTLGFGLELIINTIHKQKAIRDIKAIATSPDLVFQRNYHELFQKAKINQLTQSLCPVNGGYTAWKEHKCTKSCGGGSKLFTRTCTEPTPKYGGLGCVGKHRRSEECNVQPCPIDGKWSPWKLSKCSKSCGGGQRLKSRTCTNPAPKYGGKDCDGGDKNILSCADQPCPIDGGWSKWIKSACTKTCGGGKEQLKRSCTNPKPQYHGKDCSGDKTKYNKCNEHPCPIPGNWSPWSPVSQCSKKCGGGAKVLERTCTNPKPQYGGKYCSGENKKDVSCNTQHCPIPGGWTQWTDTQCTKSCGGGSRTRTRSCTEPPPRYGGKSCQGPISKVLDCNTDPCPIDGNWSPWTKGQCTKSCGGGDNVYRRSCSKPPPQHGGKECVGSETKTLDCNTHKCPIDGGWSKWIVGSCSKPCGGGLEKYSRKCNNPTPQYKGKDCFGEPTKDVECNTQLCPVDGHWSPWSGYDKCTKSCGGGIQKRSRTCSNPQPAHGGKACEGEIRQMKECNIQLCKLCKHFKCTGCNCNGVDYKPNKMFVTPDCKRKCICSNNHVRCKPLCVAKKHSYCQSSDRYYRKEVVGHGANGACYCYKAGCYKSSCVRSCPKSSGGIGSIIGGIIGGLIPSPQYSKPVNLNPL